MMNKLLAYEMPINPNAHEMKFLEFSKRMEETNPNEEII